MEQKAPVKYPLIITLELDAENKALFNALRKAHFPAHANYLEAHLTLFYHLPSNESSIQEHLKVFAGRGPIELQVQTIKSIGNGLIYSIASEELQQLHIRMQKAFMPWLKKQDQQPLRPHITIQNKVTVFKATRLLETLQVSFKPFSIMGIGFSTWYYLGGPWRPAGYFPFGA